MYVKLFLAILDGSLPDEPDAFITFLIMLLIADRDGVVDKTPSAIAARGRKLTPLDVVERGLRRLQEPDPYSRIPDEDGRRIVPLDPDRPDRGWRIVNYAFYRDIKNSEELQQQWASRSTRHRLRQAGFPENGGHCAYCDEHGLGVDRVQYGQGASREAVLACKRCTRVRNQRDLVDFLNDPRADFIQVGVVQLHPVLSRYVRLTPDGRWAPALPLSGAAPEAERTELHHPDPSNRVTLAGTTSRSEGTTSRGVRDVVPPDDPVRPSARSAAGSAGPEVHDPNRVGASGSEGHTGSPNSTHGMQIGAVVSEVMANLGGGFAAQVGTTSRPADSDADALTIPPTPFLTTAPAAAAAPATATAASIGTLQRTRRPAPSRSPKPRRAARAHPGRTRTPQPADTPAFNAGGAFSWLVQSYPRASSESERRAAWRVFQRTVTSSSEMQSLARGLTWCRDREWAAREERFIPKLQSWLMDQAWKDAHEGKTDASRRPAGSA